MTSSRVHALSLVVSIMCVVLAVVSAANVDVVTEQEKPHIVMILVDDFGWANAGWHRHPAVKEVLTPNMNYLVENGINLNRAYAFKFCSPTRSSLQSGRFPTHVNDKNLMPNVWNSQDKESGYAGIPVNMTGMAQHMKAGGYATHMVGKWDAGMATPRHTPMGRGYDTWLGYFHHDNWTEKVGACKVNTTEHHPVDIYATAGPAYGLNGSVEYGATGPEVAYEEYKFKTAFIDVLKAHPVETPGFFFYAPHIVHVPTQYFDKFDFMTDDYGNNRQLYAAMVNYVDGVIGNITATLKAKGMWDNTVVVLQSDNGGPSFEGSNHTANNYPLRGSKMVDTEGGVRTNAFVSGGYLARVAPHMVGTQLDGYVHVADHYATFAALAGVDPTDHEAAAAGLPPIDSLNMWPYYTGVVSDSPRTSIYGSVNMAIVGDLKVITGDVKGACWAGPTYPNATQSPLCKAVLDCAGGCLFNITADPTEHVRLEKERPEDLKAMLNNLATMNQTYFNPSRGKAAEQACEQTVKNGNFWGPFVFDY